MNNVYPLEDFAESRDEIPESLEGGTEPNSPSISTKEEEDEVTGKMKMDEEEYEYEAILMNAEGLEEQEHERKEKFTNLMTEKHNGVFKEITNNMDVVTSSTECKDAAMIDMKKNRKPIVCKMEKDVPWENVQHKLPQPQKHVLELSPSPLRRGRPAYNKEDSSSSLWESGMYVPDYEVRSKLMKE